MQNGAEREASSGGAPLPDPAHGRFATLAAALLYLIFLFRWRNRALGVDVPDSSPFYPASDLPAFFEAIGEAGIHVFVVTELTLDLLLPVVYWLLLREFLRWLGAGRKVKALPLAAALSDVVENVSLVAAALRFPEDLGILASVAAVAISVKWVLVGVTGLAVLVLGTRAWLRDEVRGPWKERDLVVAAGLVVVATVVVAHWLPAAVGVFILAAIWLYRRRLYVPQYIFFLRFPLLMGLALLLLPEVAAVEGTARMVGNLFILHGGWQLFLVALGAGLLGITVVSGLRVVFLTAPARTKLAIRYIDRAGQRPSDYAAYNQRWVRTCFPWAGWLLPLIGVLLALPFVLEVLYRSPGLPLAPLLLGLAVAAGSAYVARWIWGRNRAPVLDLAKRAPADLGPWLQRLGDPDEKPLLGFGGQGHLPILGWVVLVLGGYVLIGIWGYPAPMRAVDDVPALLYLFFVAVWGMSVLSVLALLLDNSRVPVLVLALVGLFVLYRFSGVDSYHVVSARDDVAPPTPAEYLRAWSSVREARADESGGTLTVVAVSGGGIKAALWSGRVLQALDSIVGPAFGESVGLLSTNSGGSVGAMYFTDGYSEAGPPDANYLRRMVSAAGASSLSASAWAIAYPDLASFLSGGLSRRLSFLPSRTMDRGWALDRRWERRRVLVHDSAADFSRAPRRLGDWVEGVREGWRPAHIFNATVVESGAPFRLATVDLGTETVPPAPGSQPQEFFDSFEGRDIELATAARLSAAFPWVTPMSRPWLPTSTATRRAYRVADGGYFDNFGVYSAIQFLRDVGPGGLADAGIRRVLFLEIRASKEEAVPAAAGGLHYGLVGPVLAMNNVLFSSQIANNSLVLELFREAWSGSSVQLCSVAFSLGEPGPLSWHLSSTDRRSVIEAWQRGDHGLQAGAVADFLSDGSCDEPAQ